MMLFLCAAAAASTRAPAAWRALQPIPTELTASGQLAGSPPCVATLRKVSSARSRKGAAWRLATYRDESNDLAVNLQLDRNPDEPCCKLLFHDAASDARVGYMLLACGETESSLRGMHVEPELRGRGLSRVLLAIWLRMCREAGLSTATRTINKPLLSLTLARFGFTPVHGRGVASLPSLGASVTSTVHAKGRGVKAYGGAGGIALDARRGGARVAYVRTAFVAPDQPTLDEAVEAVLMERRLLLEASPLELRRALTLRGGWHNPGTAAAPTLPVALALALAATLGMHAAAAVEGPPGLLPSPPPPPLRAARAERPRDVGFEELREAAQEEERAKGSEALQRLEDERLMACREAGVGVRFDSFDQCFFFGGGPESARLPQGNVRVGPGRIPTW